MKKISITLVCLSALAALTTSAGARGVTPLNGMPYLSTEASCFRNSWALLSNVFCAGAPRGWMVDAPIDTSGNYKNFNIVGKGNGSTPITCDALGLQADGQTGWKVTAERTSATSGTLYQAAPSVYVPLNGTLHFECGIPQGGGVSAFHYDV